MEQNNENNPYENLENNIKLQDLDYLSYIISVRIEKLSLQYQLNNKQEDLSANPYNENTSKDISTGCKTPF